MSNNFFQYVPFITSNDKYLNTINDEIFSVKKEIDGYSTFTLYKNSAEINRVNKIGFLTPVGNVYGVYRDLTSVTELTILIEYPRYIDFNYVYIKEFKRYYFVTDIKVSTYGMYEIDLTVDVLMSYLYAIRNLKAFVDRNESTANHMLIDKKRIIEQGIDIEVHTIENDVFYGENNPILEPIDKNLVINGYKIYSGGGR